MNYGPLRNSIAISLSALLFASAALAVVPAHCLRAWLSPASADSDVAAAHGAKGHRDAHTMHGAVHMAHENATADLTTADLMTTSTTTQSLDKSSHLTQHPTPQPSPHSGSEACVDCASVMLSCCDVTTALRSEALVLTRDDELTRIHTVAVSTVTRHPIDIRPPIPAPRLASTPHAATHRASSPALLGVFLI